MSVEMWNCHSWPLDVSSNVKLPFLTTRCPVTMWNCHSWPLDVSNNISGDCISNLVLVSTFDHLYVYICTGNSLYFLISWLFWMGSHWWHWTRKISLCALAVLNGGVHHKFWPLGKTDFSLYFPINWLFQIAIPLVTIVTAIWVCFCDHWQFQMGGLSVLPP